MPQSELPLQSLSIYVTYIVNHKSIYEFLLYLINALLSLETSFCIWDMVRREGNNNTCTHAGKYKRINITVVGLFVVLSFA